MTTESPIQRAITVALKRIGKEVLRIQCGRVKLAKGGWMHLAPEGTADLLILPERMFIETKSAAGMKGRSGNPKTRAAQEKFQAYCERNDIPYLKTDDPAEAVRWVVECSR